MNMEETITWHPASEPPDNDREVLAADTPLSVTVTLSYRPDSGDWYSDGAWTDAPTYWAELPKGPQV